MELALAIVGIVILAAIALFAASRRSDANAAISAETRKRDKSRVAAGAVGAAP